MYKEHGNQNINLSVLSKFHLNQQSEFCIFKTYQNTDFPSSLGHFKASSRKVSS